MSGGPIVIAEQASKTFQLSHTRTDAVKDRVLGVFGRRPAVETFTALERVSFTVHEGESVALVGRNGSGKSTLLKLIAGIHHATGGRLLVRRGLRIATMIELGVGFHPDLTGEENVRLNAAIHGLAGGEIDAIYPEVVKYSELEHFMDAPIKTYSSGMVMRLGFAIGVQLDPDVFLLDEIFAVGDEAFQRKCLASMRAFQDRGRTMFFVSHSAEAVREMCRRSLVLDHGRLQFDGDVAAGLRHYRRLIGEEPSLAGGDPAAGLSAAEQAALGRDEGWHRRAVATGDSWDRGAAAHLAFLRAQGLTPSQHVLDLGCGPLRTGLPLMAFLQPGHYVGVDCEPAMIEAGQRIEAPRAGVDPQRGHYYLADVANLSAVSGAFDVIFSAGLMECLTYVQAARMLASAIRLLAPGGRFFLAFQEASGAALLDRIERPGPSFSTLEGPLRHFDFATLARLAELAGGHAERLGEWGDPHGQVMMVVTRRK